MTAFLVFAAGAGVSWLMRAAFRVALAERSRS